jgi:hypothetical protein
MEITKFLDVNFPNRAIRDPALVRQAIYKHAILATYESDGANPDDVKENPTAFRGRMIFYGSKNQRMVDSHALQLECNGLVLDTETWKPVVIPPLLFRSNVQTDVVNRHLASDLYDMLSVSDGTVATFYYWEPKDQWRIATSRGYDMTECKWGTKTYLEIWNEICTTYEYKSSDEFFDALDKTRSYTFGFKHESMHPFKEATDASPRKAWFIQSASLTDFNDVEYTHTGVIPNQVLYKAPKHTHLIYTSLTKSLQNYLDDGTVDFGYILRSRNPAITGGHTHIVFESSLMQQIRQLYYHSDFHRDAASLNYDRETYTVVYSYLDPNRHGMFVVMFPQHRRVFDRLSDITADLVRDMITYAKNPVAVVDNPRTQKIMTLYHTMSQDFTIDPNDKHILKILMSYLMNTRWVSVYYDLYVADDIAELSTALDAM